MRVLDLFSGIGGFSLGLERAGMNTVAFCEIEEFPRKVLAKHWPDVPCYSDIRELTKEVLDADGITADLICGGYPCQPFSAAGKREGAEDDRHLWPEMYRLIKTIRPRWVLAENVAGHISMGLDDVLSDLEDAGYAWWTFVVPACAVDAKHRRDRVWIVGNTSSKGLQGRHEHGENRKARQTGCKQDGYTTQAGSDEGRTGYNKPIKPALCSLVDGVPSGLAGFGWLPEPRIGRVAKGIPDRVSKLKALGNAVVPQVVEVIGRAIMEADNEH